jgi:putative membrane protein
MTLALAPLLAFGGDDHEHWWIVAPFFWALWLAVLGTILYFVFRGKRRWASGDNRAKAILAERFARGEISTDEFRERMDALR